MKEIDITKFNDLCKIKNINERVTIACERFYKKEVSAKVIRMLFDKLDKSMKINMLNLLYGDIDKRESNFVRLPPNMFFPELAIVDDNVDIELYGTLGKYYLIKQYYSSKTQDKFYKFRNTINKFLGDSFINFSFPSSMYKRKDIETYAIKGFVKELMYKGKQYDIDSLGLPLSMTIGTEIEVIGFNFEEMSEIIRKLKKYDVNFLKRFSIKRESSVDRQNRGGCEIVSPVLNDIKEDWSSLRDACLFIQAIGGDVNKTCGGHIHIGENILGVDKDAWKIFLKIWAEVEPLMYMISNRKGEKTRGKIKIYGKMVDKNIRQLNWDLIHLNNEIDIKRMVTTIHNNSRFCSLNLKNIGNTNKNTIEFRIANGTVNYDIWRENILLFGRMLQTAKICSIDYNSKKEKLEKLFEPDLPEKEKLIRFLDLIFDNEREKQIFYKRWESRSGENPLFGKKSVTTYYRQEKSERKNFTPSI